jgi:hypothetical protein
MVDSNNIIPGNPDNLGKMNEAEPSIPNNKTLSGGDLGTNLPSDLKIPVAKTSTTAVVESGSGIDDLLTQRSDMSKKNALTSTLPKLSKIPWGWIVGGIFVALLILATIYFLSSRISVNTGTLNLSFDPMGVDVIIDGKFKKQSVSSLIVKLKTGVHIVEATKDGYLDFEREIDIASKEKIDLNIVLQTIPNLEVLVEESTKFVDLIKSDKAIAYLDDSDNFEVIDLVESSPLPAAVFQDTFDNVQSVIWSPGDPTAIIKLRNTFKLTNMYDNRSVLGRFIPFGESPKQGLPFNNGVATWLFSDILRTAKGWQPVLLNESIRGVDFAPDGSRIIYFYETADGERSLVIAHPNGDEWERVISKVNMDNPNLRWLNDDRYVLMFDDGDAPDKLFNTVDQEFKEIMPDRAKHTTVEDSPDGARLLYVADEGGDKKLAVWNIASGVREFIFEESTKAFTWQDDDTAVIVKNDNSFWYWHLTGKLKPVKFISAVGELSPQQLLYSALLGKLLIVEENRIIQLSIN